MRTIAYGLLALWPGLHLGCAQDPAPHPRPVERAEVPPPLPIPSPAVITATPPPAPEPYYVADKLPGISRVHPLGDGSVELRISDAQASEGWVLATKDHSSSVITLWPLQGASFQNDSALGYGYHAYQYRGDRDGYLLFRETSWFYDIIPESNVLRAVRPYGTIAE